MKLPLGYQINEVGKLFRDVVRKKANNLGINSTYTFILQFLERHPEGMTQVEIANTVCLKAPTISLTLNQMEQEGLICREKSEEDSRKMLVKLTDKGQSLSNKLRDLYREAEGILTNSLSEEEYDNLTKYLEKMKNALREGE